MRRFVAVSLLVAVVAVIIAPADGSSGARPSANFPVLDGQPQVVVSDADRLLLRGAVSQVAMELFGVDEESFSSTRLLANTSTGPIYVLTGTSGVCLVAPSANPAATSCDFARGRGQVISLLVADPTRTLLVGGGITTRDVSSVRLERSRGSAVDRTPSGGHFVVDESEKIGIDESIEVVPRGGQTAESVAAASAAGHGLGSRVAASSQAAVVYHCTRYAPSVLAQDTGCYRNNTMTTGSFYTPGVALRDSNEIMLSSARGWELWYVNSTIRSVGNGTYGWIGTSQGAYRQAACRMGSGANTSGNCTTYWH
jgi:hypothetical protein